MRITYAVSVLKECEHTKKHMIYKAKRKWSKKKTANRVICESQQTTFRVSESERDEAR